MLNILPNYGKNLAKMKSTTFLKRIGIHFFLLYFEHHYPICSGDNSDATNCATSPIIAHFFRFYFPTVYAGCFVVICCNYVGTRFFCCSVDVMNDLSLAQLMYHFMADSF